MTRHYILDGHTPVACDNIALWGALLEDGVARTVDRTVVDGDTMVSTVFLVLDHNMSGRGAPLIFETLVFGGVLDGETMRYTTWDCAARGHAMMVERCRATNVHAQEGE